MKDDNFCLTKKASVQTEDERQCLNIYSYYVLNKLRVQSRRYEADNSQPDSAESTSSGAVVNDTLVSHRSPCGFLVNRVFIYYCKRLKGDGFY